MTFLKKMRYYENGNEHKVRCFLGIPYMETITCADNGKIVKSHKLIFGKKNDVKKRFLYLKVNRSDFFVIPCVQHWIDTAYEMDANFVIICDKNELKNKILKECSFYHSYPEFIRSYIHPLKRIVNNICRTDFWKKATYAHLSTIYHANKYGIKKFWNIDADDTMILLSPKRTAELLITAEHYAEQNKIDAFSLDMHESENNGKNFTWGITYLNDRISWMSLFEQIKDNRWQQNYLHNETAFNSDNYMLYLKDQGITNNKSFYANNLYFLHYANITSWSIGYTMYYWRNSTLHFPLLKSLNMESLDLPISKTCENLEFNIDEQESFILAQKIFFKRQILEKERHRWL